MNYRNPQLLDELAAQYVLGTLRGRARVRFEKLCEREAEAAQSLRRWEDRLVGLVSEVHPVKPPAHVWKQIQQRLGHGRSERAGFIESLLGWLARPQLAMAAGIAAIAFAIAVTVYISVPQTEQFAQIENEQHVEQWQVQAPKDHAKLVVSRSAIVCLPPKARRS